MTDKTLGQWRSEAYEALRPLWKLGPARKGMFYAELRFKFTGDVPRLRDATAEECETIINFAKMKL